MNRVAIKIKLNLTLYSQLIIGSGFGTAGLVDLSTVKDLDNIVYIPGSSLKGKIRSEFKKTLEALRIPVCNSVIGNTKEICKGKDIKDACPLCRIFGSEFYQGSLIFENAVMDPDTRAIIKKIEKDKIFPMFECGLRTGTKINRYLRTVEEKALYTLEGINPALRFHATIRGSCYITPDECCYLSGTISAITHIGGHKSRGMGRCNVNIEEFLCEEANFNYS